MSRNFLLDTDHVGILQQQASSDYERLWARISACPSDVFFISIITFHEQVAGWYSYLNRARATIETVRAYGRFRQILTTFANAQLLDFDASSGRVFDDLRKQRLGVSTMDLRIGAIGPANNCVVLTRNFNDFCRIPGLAIEDWIK